MADRGGLLDRAGRFLHSLFLDATWNIGVVYDPPNRFLDPSYRPRVHWLPTLDSNRFAADPMVIEQQGRIFLLYEDFDFRAYRGRIYGCELSPTPADNPALTWPPRPVFEEDVHLSYPYLFSSEGQVYCVPERAEAREVVLHRAVELPHRWERQTVLLPGVPAYDSTLFVHEGRWWLLATQPDARGEPNAELYVWFADRPTGPWQAHPRNPVKRDLASARPAGPPFVHEGRLYRPAQDCSRTYGGRLVLHRIDQLTTTDFVEEPVGHVDPDPTGLFPDGLHTLASAGGLTVLDGKRFFFNRHAFRYNLGVKLKRLRLRLTRSS